MDTLETIQKENSELRKKIETHDDDLKRLRGVLYHLIGGIFNQKTQGCVMRTFIHELFGTTSSEQEAEAETEETQWPTTRQGDNNEERIRKLEETVQKLEKQIENMEKRQEHVVKM